MLHFQKLILSALAVSGALLSGAQAKIIKTSPVANMCKKPGDFAFTFDGGASIYTGHVLDALAQHKCKATFHPVVTYLQDVTVVANIQRAALDGHLIGLSIETDLDLSKLDDNDILSNINSRAEVLALVTGYKPRFLRIHNFQSLSEGQINLIHEAGYRITTYNLDSYDYNTPDCIVNFKKILDLLSVNTKGAFISVQRDYVPESAKSTEEILRYVIEEKKYRPVTLEECLGMGKSSTNSTFIPKHGNVTQFDASNPNSGASAHGLGMAPLVAMTAFSVVAVGSLFLFV